MALHSLTLECTCGKDTKSAITPVIYRRDDLLSLSKSPLAITYGSDMARLGRLASMLSADGSPSPERLGTHIKSFFDTSFDNDSQVGGSLATNARLLPSPKLTAGSYTPIQFDSKRYAARFAAPITPDPSLMKPVDIQWTLSMTSQLVTPTGQAQMEVISLATSEASSMRQAGLAEQKQEMLRPSAKVFIPSGIPILKSNPQPRRGLRSSIHAEAVMEEEKDSSDAYSLQKSMVNSPAHSMTTSATYAASEVPKALTPLAAPSASAGLPPRPVACAVKPNLPRWAHSPKHTKAASSYSDYGHSVGLSQPILIRRASPSAISQGGLPREQEEQFDSSATSKDDFDECQSSAMSSGTRSNGSGSMTPWAQHGKAGECKIGSHSFNRKMPAIPITSDLSHKMERINLHAISGRPTSSSPNHVIRDVSPVTPFTGNSWRRQPHKSVPGRPTRPRLTPSIPGGLLGAVPMHSVNAN